MYCANCGVELQKGIAKCPLCGLKAYHPDLPAENTERSYPALTTAERKTHTRGLMVIISLIILIPILLCIAIDLNTNRRILWSGYVVGGILCAYFALFFPLWFRKRNPVIFFPVGMASVLLLTLYICLKTGGKWFLSFAFPLIGVFTLIAETMIVLIRYTCEEHKNRVAVIAGAGIIALGAAFVLMEFLLHVTFGIPMVWWSFIPFIVLTVLGILCIVIGLSEPLRESLYKRFFI